MAWRLPANGIEDDDLDATLAAIRAERDVLWRERFSLLRETARETFRLVGLSREMDNLREAIFGARDERVK